MSLAGPTSRPAAFSGATKPGMPESTPVCGACAVRPKPVSCGPFAASSTLAGVRSPWIKPAAWAALSASASPAASVSKPGKGSGP